METPNKDKPDFEALAKKVFPEYYGDRFFPNNAEDNQLKKNQQYAYRLGCEKIWNDYVVPRDQTIQQQADQIRDLERQVKELQNMSAAQRYW